MLLLPKFEYFEPATIGEACSLLAQYKGEAKALAGGTDLLVKMKTGVIKPRCLVNLKNIADLEYIEDNAGNGLSIGALTSIHNLIMSPFIGNKFGILSQAIRLMGTAQTRSMATVGGNLCNASPAAATATPLVALGAEAKIAGPGGERTVPVEKFFTGPGKTVLETGEILTGVKIPNMQPYSGGRYLKLSLRKNELAVVSVAVLMNIRDNHCYKARIALGAVAPTVIRANRAEKILEGKIPSEDLITEASIAASEEARPISDIRSTAEYRIEIIKVLTKRAIKQVLESVR